MKVAIILKSPCFCGIVAEENVIYADAGYKYADRIGKKNVLGVVGDFDSLKSAPRGEKIIELEVEKNFTDGERAVHFAKECGAEEIVLYGAFGGKIEHILGNIVLLKIASDIGLSASIKDGDVITELFSGKRKFGVKKGGTVSLIPYGGNCTVRESKGLYYPLENLTLTPADTRGISNVAENDVIELDAVIGEALIIYEK